MRNPLKSSYNAASYSIHVPGRSIFLHIQLAEPRCSTKAQTQRLKLLLLPPLPLRLRPREFHHKPAPHYPRANKLDTSGIGPEFSITTRPSGFTQMSGEGKKCSREKENRGEGSNTHLGPDRSHGACFLTPPTHDDVNLLICR